MADSPCQMQFGNTSSSVATWGRKRAGRRSETRWTRLSHAAPVLRAVTCVLEGLPSLVRLRQSGAPALAQRGAHSLESYLAREPTRSVTVGDGFDPAELSRPSNLWTLHQVTMRRAFADCEAAVRSRSSTFGPLASESWSFLAHPRVCACRDRTPKPQAFAWRPRGTQASVATRCTAGHTGVRWEANGCHAGRLTGRAHRSPPSSRRSPR